MVIFRCHQLYFQSPRDLHEFNHTIWSSICLLSMQHICPYWVEARSLRTKLMISLSIESQSCESVASQVRSFDFYLIFLNICLKASYGFCHVAFFATFLHAKVNVQKTQITLFLLISLNLHVMHDNFVNQTTVNILIFLVSWESFLLIWVMNDKDTRWRIVQTLRYRPINIKLFLWNQITQS